MHKEESRALTPALGSVSLTELGKVQEEQFGWGVGENRDLVLNLRLSGRSGDSSVVPVRSSGGRRAANSDLEGVSVEMGFKPSR